MPSCLPPVLTSRLVCQAGALAVCLLLSACQPPKAQDFEVQLTTQPDPARVGTARVELTLLGVPAAAVSLEGNMTHAGMAPVRAQATPTGKGRYMVGAFDLNMAGSWVVTVTARTDDGRTLITDVPLEVFPP